MTFWLPLGLEAQQVQRASRVWLVEIILGGSRKRAKESNSSRVVSTA